MAALSAQNPTLLDYANAMDPKDQIAPVIEILDEQNALMKTAVMLEGNLLTGHQHKIRTGIPEPTFRKLYGYTQPSKTERATVTDNTGQLAAYAEVDIDLARRAASMSAFRTSEARGIIEGFAQKAERYAFYGNEGTEPEAFTGLAPRYNSLSAENAENIIVGGSVTDSVNTSIWLVVWGEDKVHLIHPQGSSAGLSRTDRGQQTLTDSSGGHLEVLLELFKWDLGLALGDWRYVVRIPNIQVSALTSDAATGANLITLLTKAVELPPNLRSGRAVIYCNRTIKTFLRLQMVAKVVNSTLTMEMVGGKPVMSFDGIPVERSDEILNTETLVA